MIKPIVTLAFALFFGALRVTAQEWRSVDIPQIGSESIINDLLFISADTGFIVGENNTCLRSDDRGRTWSWVEPSIPCSHCVDNYRGIDFDQGNLVIDVSRESPFASSFQLVSSDRGNSWDSIKYETRDRSFSNESKYWKAVKGTRDLFSVRYSSSGDYYNIYLDVYDRSSESWLLRSSILSTYSEHREPDIAFVMASDSVGVLSVSETIKGYFYARTTDGGHTWKIDTGQQCCQFLYKIEPNVLLAKGTRWQRSSDFGATWVEDVIGEAYPSFDDITSHTSGLVYGVSNFSNLSKGKLFESHDFGRTWNNYRVSVDDNFGRSAIIVDTGLAFLIGYDSLYSTLPKSSSVEKPFVSDGFEVLHEQGRLIISPPAGWTHRIRICDLLGREVYSNFPVTREIIVELSDLPHGTYILESQDYKHKFVR